VTMKTLIILSIVTLLSGCSSQPKPQPDVPAPEVLDQQQTTLDCSAACEHLREMKCELGQPSRRGKTCEDLCNTLENNGVKFISCTIDADTCDNANNCV
jgi:hypothetical protein